jgi:SAM-dependent methyltransferase
MAKLKNNGQAVEYDSYDEYKKIQDSKYHDYDCQTSLNNNLKLLSRFNDALNVKYKNLLDIGCRDAAYFDILGEKNIKCFGIDISEKSVIYANSKNRKVILGDASRLTEYFYKKKFDIIVSNHSFEHFIDPIKVLNECYTSLKKDGHFVILIPNENGKIKNTKTLAHAFAYSIEIFLDLISKTNFKVLKITLLDTNEIFIILKKE